LRGRIYRYLLPPRPETGADDLLYVRRKTQTRVWFGLWPEQLAFAGLWLTCSGWHSRTNGLGCRKPGRGLGRRLRRGRLLSRFECAVGRSAAHGQPAASAVAVSPGFQGRVWCGWLPICLFYPLLPLPAPSDMDPIGLQQTRIASQKRARSISLSGMPPMHMHPWARLPLLFSGRFLWAGCCRIEAAGLVLLLRERGYDNASVCTSMLTLHAWTMPSCTLALSAFFNSVAAMRLHRGRLLCDHSSCGSVVPTS
jgi:hypothetical protein